MEPPTPTTAAPRRRAAGPDVERPRVPAALPTQHRRHDGTVAVGTAAAGTAVNRWGPGDRRTGRRSCAATFAAPGSLAAVARVVVVNAAGAEDPALAVLATTGGAAFVDVTATTGYVAALERLTPSARW